ncbi:MAG: hypothetical protein IIZ45_05775, partial [Firmicutes bacterium]|nr:hypothetical protein [Bacillota bacterium]
PCWPTMKKPATLCCCIEWQALFIMSNTCGAELVFIEDQRITVKVVGDHKAEHKGKITSMTAVAQKPKDVETAIAGTVFLV